MSRLAIFGIDGHRRDPPRRRPGRHHRRRRGRRRRHRAGRRRRRRRHPEDRVEGRGPAGGRVDPDDPLSATSRSSSGESVRILRRRGDLIISETKHGFVCANAGIDLSNVERGLRRAAARRHRPLGPPHPRRHPRARPASTSPSSCRDTFGRTWRRGVTDVAIGCAGIAAVVDLRGTDRRPRPRAAGHRGRGRRRARRRRRAGHGQGDRRPGGRRAGLDPAAFGEGAERSVW